MVDKYEDFILRFLRLEAEDIPQNPNYPWILSSDRTLGVPKKLEEWKFTSFGKFKLAGKRQRKPVSILGLYFDSQRLYRAMCVLRRRKRFELGLYQMSSGEVFAIREGQNLILIAPAVFDGVPEGTIEFKDFVTRINKSFFEKWKTWQRILTGRRSS